jgi:hypothetical protein
MKDMKASMEFVHAEVADLKKESEEWKKEDLEVKRRLQRLEESNALLNNRVIDLQARWMRDNLLFYNTRNTCMQQLTPRLYSPNIVSTWSIRSYTPTLNAGSRCSRHVSHGNTIIGFFNFLYKPAKNRWNLNSFKYRTINFKNI